MIPLWICWSLGHSPTGSWSVLALKVNWSRQRNSENVALGNELHIKNALDIV